MAYRPPTVIGLTLAVGVLAGMTALTGEIHRLGFEMLRLDVAMFPDGLLPVQASDDPPGSIGPTLVNPRGASPVHGDVIQRSG